MANPMSLINKYKKSLDNQWCLRFKTCHPDGDRYDGVVTQINKSFVVLQEEVDFVFNGILVLPKKSISGYGDNKYDSCCNKILRENGAIRRLRSPHWLTSCATLHDVLSQLRSRRIWPIVEVLFDENKDSAFYIGPVTKIEESHCYLKCYDAAGQWEKEYQLTYEEIFKIEFGSIYCKNFNAYMRKRDGT